MEEAHLAVAGTAAGMEAVMMDLAAQRGQVALVHLHRAVATELEAARPETAEEEEHKLEEVADRRGSHRMFQRGQILPVPPDHLNHPRASKAPARLSPRRQARLLSRTDKATRLQLHTVPQPLRLVLQWPSQTRWAAEQAG